MMHNRRSNKAIEIDFEAEHQKHLDYIKSQIGKPVPLSHAYTKGEHPILVAIDGDKALPVPTLKREILCTVLCFDPGFSGL